MNHKENIIDISVVLPCYKPAYFIPELYTKLKKTLLSLDISYEIIFIDDASPDNDWNKIQTISQQDSHIIGIQLSRNFGQHSAIYAGLTETKGKWIVVMDSDLQDDPQLISLLYQKALEGFDSVFAKRSIQKESWFKVQTSKLFYKTLNYLTDIKTPYNIGNFGIFNRKVINSILEMKDYKRNFVVMANWVGYKSTSIDTYRQSRSNGKSTYSLSKMCSLGLSTIVYFSNKPLTLIVQTGFLISFISVLFVIYFIAKKILIGTAISGWTSLIVSIFIIGGIQISLIGIIGIYIGQIFYQTKKRPSFIIKNKIMYD